MGNNEQARRRLARVLTIADLESLRCRAFYQDCAAESLGSPQLLKAMLWWQAGHRLSTKHEHTTPV